jgi:DNA-binding transcriptional LysR family regulator
MDRLEAMRILLLSVERGSFSAAGRELRMPLPTVSRKVSDLEAHLGARLLVRTTRRLALTDAGTEYVASARRILGDIEEAERIAAGEFQSPRGDLVLAVPVLFGRLHVLPIVTAFLGCYPDINVRLHLSDRNVDLIGDHVDMAVRIGPLPDSSMVATRIGSMRTVTCVSPVLLAGQDEPASPDDLAALPCVSFDAMSPRLVWPFRNIGKAAMQVPIRPRLSVSTAEAAVWAAAQGIGVTRVLHYQCAEALSTGSLRLILTPFEVEPLPVHLIHAARGGLPLKMRVFLDYATTRLRQTLQGRRLQRSEGD